MELPEGLGGKIFKGCGCLSIGFVLMIILVVVIGICYDDEETDEKEEEQKTEQVEKKDSIVVNEPLQGDPYKELDELIGLDQVKEEVRSLANFVKIQKQREKNGLKTPKMSFHHVTFLQHAKVLVNTCHDTCHGCLTCTRTAGKHEVE